MKKEYLSQDASFLMYNHGFDGWFRDESDVRNAQFHSKVSIALMKKIMKDNKMNKRYYKKFLNILNDIENDIDKIKFVKKEDK